MPDHEEAVREARKAAFASAWYDGGLATLSAKLGTFEAAIRASERAKYAALVEDIERYFNVGTPQDEYDALAAMDRFIAAL